MFRECESKCICPRMNIIYGALVEKPKQLTMYTCSFKDGYHALVCRVCVRECVGLKVLATEFVHMYIYLRLITSFELRACVFCECVHPSI